LAGRDRVGGRGRNGEVEEWIEEGIGVDRGDRTRLILLYNSSHS